MPASRTRSARRAPPSRPARGRLPGVFRSFRILDAVPPADAGSADEALLICPWLRGLDPEDGLFLSALPIHDCNAFIDGDFSLDAAAAGRERCYVGVFAIDRLRQTDKLLGQLRDRGVARLINLPTVSFFDDATARAFAALGFTLEAEIAFLEHARRNGFGVALCAPAGASVAMPRDGFDFILRHNGPGKPLSFEAPEAG